MSGFRRLAAIAAVITPFRALRFPRWPAILWPESWGFRKCKACHAISAADGSKKVKGGKTGPDLYAVIGRSVGSLPGFAYGESLLAAGASGKIWSEASLAAYVADPTAWLQTATGDPSARSKMSFKLAKGGADIAAYLATFGPAPAN